MRMTEAQQSRRWLRKRIFFADLQMPIFKLCTNFKVNTKITIGKSKSSFWCWCERKNETESDVYHGISVEIKNTSTIFSILHFNVPCCTIVCCSHAELSGLDSYSIHNSTMKLNFNQKSTSHTHTLFIQSYSHKWKSYDAIEILLPCMGNKNWIHNMSIYNKNYTS